MTQERKTTINGFQAPLSLAIRLDNFAEHTGRTKTDVLVKALTRYLEEEIAKEKGLRV